VSHCIICSIVSGAVSAKKVYEDELCIAFLDIHPTAIGHTMLVPKTHASRIEDLTPEQSQALFEVLHNILAPIREAVGADATTVGVNNGPGSGQEVPHVHIHIIPRRRGDRGGIIQQLGPGAGGDLEESAERISAKIASTL
jgi:histidine triad (HIT) family protein